MYEVKENKQMESTREVETSTKADRDHVRLQCLKPAYLLLGNR